MKLTLEEWQKIEYLSMKLQWFYVWEKNYSDNGNVTNSLLSYMDYGSLHDESVKPTISQKDLKWLSYNLKHQPKSFNKVIITSNRWVNIDNSQWRHFVKSALIFLKIYQNFDGHNLPKLPQDALIYITNISDTINSKNQIRDTNIMQKAIANQPLNSEFYTIKNNKEED